MLKRTLTALLLIPPVVYLLGWSPKWLFVMAVAAAVVLALREYFALCRTMGVTVFSWIGYGASLALCVVQMLPKPREAVAPLLVFILLIMGTLAIGMTMDLKDYLRAVSTTFFGVVYIGLTLACLVPVRFSISQLGSDFVLGGAIDSVSGLRSGSRLVLLLFLVIWAGDTSAYLVGRSMGRTPFFARISPRKTWEGAVAGLAGSLLLGGLFGHWFLPATSLKTVILLSALIAVAGQAGDLVESAIKRGANMKDSGTLLPGHGGFLDRIDSLLFAVPALWVALSALGYFS